MTKADIVREAARLGLDAGLSWSCYDPAPGGAIAAFAIPAGCARGVRGGGLPDPTLYAASP